MISKFIRSILGVSLLFNPISAGIITIRKADEQFTKKHLYQHQETIVPSSYMQFHGPVEGPEYEVKVPYVDLHRLHQKLADNDGHNHVKSNHQDKDYRHADSQQQHYGEYAMDYMAAPKYQFSYGVEDHHTGDFHSQKESRDGSSVSGEYSVAEPDGGMRVVSYRADKHGFRAIVQMHGKTNHYGYPEEVVTAAASRHPLPEASAYVPVEEPYDEDRQQLLELL